MTQPPAWLAALHQQWQKSRGGRPTAATASFSRDWEKLLDDAGLHSAEDRAAAGREAKALERSGHLVLKPKRYGQEIDRIRIPLPHESWLRSLFHSEDPAVLRERSLAIVNECLTEEHPRHPELWRAWCERLAGTMAAGLNERPFSWRRPKDNRTLLSLVRSLTSREWPSPTLVRDADAALGQPTKTIESRRRALELALTQMFGGPTPLESLGLITTNSSLLFDGPLTLHFADGTCDESRHLRHGDAVTAADLERAVRISTTAIQLFSVENSKTTFRRLAELNTSRDTLIFATSFPARAVRLLLEKLPLTLPHWHFGDTDPAGYHILLKLRQLTPRPVLAWDMAWADQTGSPPLSKYDERTLATLLDSREMDDVQDSLRQMQAAHRRGAFEQEMRAPALPPCPARENMPETNL